MFASNARCIQQLQQVVQEQAGHIQRIVQDQGSGIQQTINGLTGDLQGVRQAAEDAEQQLQAVRNDIVDNITVGNSQSVLHELHEIRQAARDIKDKSGWLADHVEQIKKQTKPYEPSGAQHKVYPGQKAHGYASRLQVYNSLIIVAGLLTSATYQAMYAGPVLSDGSGSLVNIECIDFAFRMLNGLSFMATAICLVSCLTGLLCLGQFAAFPEDPPSVQAADDMAYWLTEKGDAFISGTLYHWAIGSFFVAVLFALAASVLAALRLMGPKHVAMSIIAVVTFGVVSCICIWILCWYKSFQKGKRYVCPA